MADLDERLRRLGRRQAPDLWPEIQRGSRDGRSPSRARTRVLPAATALVVAGVGFAVAVRVFVGVGDDRPAATTRGKIAYVVTGEYQPGARIDDRIFLANADGSGTNKLVDGWSPAWSPDGTRIAYITDTQERSSSHLIVINVDGTNATTLYRFRPGEPGGSPAWSPDGRWIAFQTSEGIFLISPGGGPARQVTEPPTETRSGPARCWDQEASWSPDGREIVFVVDCALKPGRAGEHLGLWTVRSDGSHRRPLLARDSGSAQGWFQSPEWSPDGQRIAFTVIGTRGSERIAVIDADGGNLRRLRLGFSPAWSPDGERIVFSMRDPNDVLGGPIAVMTLDGAIVRTLTPEPTLAGDGKQYCCPAWQPSG